MTDTRVDRLPAIYVRPGEPASPFVAAGPFKITWTGLLNLRFRQEYAVGAVGRGQVKVVIGDTVAFDGAGDDLSAVALGPSTKVKKGATPIRVEYASAADGSAELRLLFSERGGRPLPAAPLLFTHEPNPALAHSRLLRRGRQRLGELRCIKCHTPDHRPAMPEMMFDAPSLADVGSRLKPAFVARWIADPKSIRPTTEMPVSATDADAGHIAAYLATLNDVTLPDVPAPTPERATAGKVVFANLGCIACHTAPDARGLAADRVPLAHVADKYQPAALVDFLKAPEKRFGFTQMPNFRLSDDEATQLAAYLLTTAPTSTGASSDGDPAQGKRLVASLGCVQCHALPLERQYSAPTLAQVRAGSHDRGCLATTPEQRGRAPDYQLSEDDRTALVAVLATDLSSLSQDHPAEIAQRQIASLNCIACHSRDEATDRWSTLGEDEAAQVTSTAGAAKPQDQPRPTLTWIGEELRPEWSEALIRGELTYKPRPWLVARMPGFPAYARHLSRGLAAQHGVGPKSPPDLRPDPDLAETGRKLAGAQGGFSCIQCHSIGPTAATAPFEAPAPNFAHVSDRVRQEWFFHWMHDPPRLKPGTRMPKFADAKGATALRDTFDGNADQQFDALWHYLLQGDRIAPP